MHRKNIVCVELGTIHAFRHPLGILAHTSGRSEGTTVLHTQREQWTSSDLPAPSSPIGPPPCYFSMCLFFSLALWSTTSVGPFRLCGLLLHASPHPCATIQSGPWATPLNSSANYSASQPGRKLMMASHSTRIRSKLLISSLCLVHFLPFLASQPHSQDTEGAQSPRVHGFSLSHLVLCPGWVLGL